MYIHIYIYIYIYVYIVYIYIYVCIENSYVKEKRNLHLSICIRNICNNMLRRSVALNPCEHAFCFICIAKELREQDKKPAKCFKCSSQRYEINKHRVYENHKKSVTNGMQYISKTI